MDIAAHAQSGAAPHVGFSQLAAATRSAAPAPLCLFGPANRAVFDELFGRTEMHAIGCYVLEGATLAPTGIAMKDKVAFSSAAFIHPPHHVATVAGRLLAADLPARHVRGPLAVIYGPGHETYGHWLVDFLPRLWVLAQCGYDILTTRFVLPPDVTRIAASLLARLGIRESQLVPYRYWREVLHTDLLVMPTGLRAGNRLSPRFADATAFWTAALHRAATPSGAAGAEPAGATRIFLSRAGAPAGRTLTNRAAIETIARQRGYALLQPETLSLAGQVAAFAAARVIAGEYGSALHGAVYARPGTTTLALRGNARHPSFIQSGLAAALGQHAGYVLGHTTGDVQQHFTIQAEDFERALDSAELASGELASAQPRSAQPHSAEPASAEPDNQDTP